MGDQMKKGWVRMKRHDLESLANHWNHTGTYLLRRSKDTSIPSQPIQKEKRLAK
jgi:hypothetical protein